MSSRADWKASAKREITYACISEVAVLDRAVAKPICRACVIVYTAAHALYTYKVETWYIIVCRAELGVDI
jgi:hypothetical protein